MDQAANLTRMIEEKDKQISKLMEQYMEKLEDIPELVELEKMEVAEK